MSIALYSMRALQSGICYNSVPYWCGSINHSDANKFFSSEKASLIEANSISLFKKTDHTTQLLLTRVVGINSKVYLAYSHCFLLTSAEKVGLKSLPLVLEETLVDGIEVT